MNVQGLSRLIYATLIAIILVDPADWWARSGGGVCNEAAVVHGQFGARCNSGNTPGLTIEPYVRPELAERLKALRQDILAAAQRHNRAYLSGMSDEEFAEVMVVVLFNEHNGWLEDAIEPLRAFTPLYQEAQRLLNRSGIGSNFSVWPTNLRPSVAREIVRGELPVTGEPAVIHVPLQLEGSRVVPSNYAAEAELLVALTNELSDERLAIEYLAANLARGVYRAHYEGQPVSWRALAAWHNQGIVAPEQIRANATARDYVRRASAYLPAARLLVAGKWETPRAAAMGGK